MNWELVLKQHLQELLRINTTNPPGGEIAAARYIAGVFDAAGIDYEVFEPAPGRGSIMARLKGDGAARPIMLVGHLDVVPAVASDWSHDPFGGEEAEGRIWGRGAIDMKKLVATWMTILLKLKAENATLKRDIIFAATADEEAGGIYGFKWICEHRPDWVDCEFALNEGGGNSVVLGGRTYVTLQTGEKASCRVQLTAKGAAGHASIPTPGNAVVKLAEAVKEIGNARLPVHATATVQAFIGAILADLGPSVLPRGTAIPSFEQIPAIVEGFVQNPFERAGILAMLSNTATPTILTAGQKLNVIPSQAIAEIDGRVLPGQSGDVLAEELKKLLPNDIELEVGPHLPATESSSDTFVADIIREVVPKHLPGSKVIPFLSPGATDARYLRPRGITVYGFDPMLPGELVNRAHGVDEHITLESLQFGLQVLDEVVRRVATHE